MVKIVKAKVQLTYLLAYLLIYKRLQKPALIAAQNIDRQHHFAI